MLRNTLELGSGLVRFHTKDNARAYMETLLGYYKTRLEEYAQQLAEELRSAPDAPEQSRREKKDSKKGKDDPKQVPRGWRKVGSLAVNGTDTKRALAEVTLRIVDDYKARIDKISEALKSFDEVDTLSQPGTSAYTLFIYRGVPEAVLVNTMEKKQEVFAFSAKFRAV